MASGDSLFSFDAYANTAPVSAFATFDLIVLLSAHGPRPVLDYAGSTEDETAIFGGIWPSQYSGNGANFRIHYLTDGTSTGAIGWRVSFEILVEGTSLATAGATFGAVVSANDTPTGTANVLDITATVAVPHSTLGSPSPGQSMRCRVTRDFNHATNTDDAQFLRIYITET